jgi:hypothetical protein
MTTERITLTLTTNNLEDTVLKRTQNLETTSLKKEENLMHSKYHINSPYVLRLRKEANLEDDDDDEEQA